MARLRAPPLGSADFQVGCIADFQIREPGMVQVALEFCCVADLEIGGVRMRPPSWGCKIFPALSPTRIS